MPTKIKWATETWNPVTGCTKISPGCKNFYAERMAKRLQGRFGYPSDEYVCRDCGLGYHPMGGDTCPGCNSTNTERVTPFDVTLHKNRLVKPMHWEKPREVFICSMGDLFHKDVPFAFVDRVCNIITRSNQTKSGDPHFFMFLTKRPARMREYFERRYSGGRLWENAAVGVTVEDQKRASERIPEILQINASWRFVSYEPALEAVDFTKVELNSGCTFSALEVSHIGRNLRVEEWPALDCIITGCESGPKRRLANPDWFRSVRDQCQQAGVSFFLKQMEIDRKVVEMPELDGQVWDQLPWRTNENQ